jgi:hypothetical protein
MNIPEPDVDLTVTLPWPTICALACEAGIRGCSLEELVVEALEEDLARRRA